MNANRSRSRQPPLLFFKVGLHGSAPREFGTDLAARLQTRLITGEGIREAMRLERAARGTTSRATPEKVNKRLFRDALPILKSKEDLVADMYFLTPNSRARTPAELARITGALTIALFTAAPLTAIEKRLAYWAFQRGKLDDFEGTLSENPNWRLFQMPGADETIDYVFPLDGTLRASELVDQVEEHLRINSLVVH